MRIQFSLRSLMIVVTLVAILGSIYSVQREEYSKRRKIITTIEQSGGKVITIPRKSILEYIYGDNLVYDIDTVLWNKPTDDGLVLVGQLPSVKRLILGGSTFSDQGINKLASQNELETLEIYNNEITDDALTVVGRFQQLKTLKLHSKNITDQGILLLKDLKNLEYVDFVENPINGEGLSFLKNCTRIHTLMLDGTQITDDSLKYVSDLKNLSYLSVRYTLITDKGLKYLSRLILLKYLCLANNNIEGDGICYLMDLIGLENLNLCECRLKEKYLNNLTQLVALKMLNIAHNYLSDEAIAKLDTCLSDTIVIVCYPDRTLPSKRVAYENGYIMRTGSSISCVSSFGPSGFNDSVIPFGVGNQKPIAVDVSVESQKDVVPENKNRN